MHWLLQTKRLLVQQSLDLLNIADWTGHCWNVTLSAAVSSYCNDGGKKDNFLVYKYYEVLFRFWGGGRGGGELAMTAGNGTCIGRNDLFGNKGGGHIKWWGLKTMAPITPSSGPLSSDQVLTKDNPPDTTYVYQRNSAFWLLTDQHSSTRDLNWSPSADKRTNFMQPIKAGSFWLSSIILILISFYFL